MVHNNCKREKIYNKAGKPSHYFTKSPSQLTLLPSAGQEMSTSQKCGDALRLGSKDRYGSFHLWRNVWLAGKMCDPALTVFNTCHT